MKIAEHLEITEDYFGFYTPDFLTAIQQKIDDMLIEANPRSYLQSEIEISQDEPTNLSPIKMLNLAWNQFYLKPDDYNTWENNTVQEWLNR